MGPLGFGRPRLWIAFLAPDNMMSAQLTQIEEIPRSADAAMCGPLLEMCRTHHRSRRCRRIRCVPADPPRPPSDG